MRFLDLPIGAVFTLTAATRGYKYVKVNDECASYKHLAYKCRINTYCLDSKHCIVLSYKAKLHTIMDLGRNLHEYRLAHLASLRQADCNDIKVSVNLKFWDSYINDRNTTTVIIDDKELINKICEYIDKKYETLSEEIHKQLNPQNGNNS